MIRKKYAVIILNFNVIDDAIKAAESVINFAIDEEFIICIADNGSTKENQVKKLEAINLKNTVVYNIGENKGYASGNNSAFKFLKKTYCFDYTIIMNPDVLINKKGTIEGLIKQIEYNDNIVGAQPLINTRDRSNKSPEYQLNIRRVPTLVDECITQIWILRKLFNKKYRKYRYIDLMPYNNNIYFEVPSGAFFAIDTKIFEAIGMFDSRTFLYEEEIILGFKLKKLNKKFILVPKYIVDHYHGKSTNSSKHVVSKFADTCLINSKKLYMKEYLSINPILAEMLYIIMKGEAKCKRVINNIIYR